MCPRPTPDGLLLMVSAFSTTLPLLLLVYTRLHSSFHPFFSVGVAAYNLMIQVICFAGMGLLALLDSKEDLAKNRWFTHVFFELAVYIVLAVLQLGPYLVPPPSQFI
jgi:uncharacterized membrane protein SirB2